MELSRRSFFKLSAAGVAAYTLSGPGNLFASVERMWADQKAFVPGKAPQGGLIRRENGTMRVCGYPVRWWEKQFGLPLCINYAPEISRRLENFKSVFQKRYPEGEIRYAVKANTHPMILSLVRDAGAGADVASDNEALCALQARLDPFHLDVNGNNKSDALIQLALDKGMLLVADSIEEFLKISEMSAACSSKPRMLLRLSGYDLKNVTYEGVFTAGKWCKFGADIQDLPHFYDLLPKHGHVDFLGFHTHIGSQVSQVEPYRIVLGKLLEFSKTVNDKGGNCRMINIGGGFPVNYYPTRKAWEEALSQIRNGYEAARKGDMSKVWVWGNSPAMFMDPATGKIDLNFWCGEDSYSPYPEHQMLDAILTGEVSLFGKRMKAVAALESLGRPALVIEPGRSIAESSGVLLMKATGFRKVYGEHHMISMDAGSVNYADALEKDYLMRQWILTESLDQKDERPYDAFLVGRLCFNSDIINRTKVRFERKPRPNEIILCRDCGAYAAHFYAANTNSFPRPSRVICYGDGSISYLKKKDTYDEIFSE